MTTIGSHLPNLHANHRPINANRANSGGIRSFHNSPINMQNLPLREGSAHVEISQEAFERFMQNRAEQRAILQAERDAFRANAPTLELTPFDEENQNNIVINGDRVFLENGDVGGGYWSFGTPQSNFAMVHDSLVPTLDFSISADQLREISQSLVDMIRSTSDLRLSSAELAMRREAVRDMANYIAQNHFVAGANATGFLNLIDGFLEDTLLSEQGYILGRMGRNAGLHMANIFRDRIEGTPGIPSSEEAIAIARHNWETRWSPEAQERINELNENTRNNFSTLINSEPFAHLSIWQDGLRDLLNMRTLLGV